MDLADAVVDALAERYSPKLMRNPKWDRKAEKAAWDSGLEYPVPEYIERPLKDQRNDVCMVAFKASDGHSSIRALTYIEIGDVVRSVIDESREAD